MIECPSCIGSGKIREEGETPKQDSWRKCMDCTGTGEVPSAVAATFDKIAAGDVHRGPFAYEFIKRNTGEGGWYRIHDAADNAFCFCYSEGDAQEAVRKLNASPSGATISVGDLRSYRRSTGGDIEAMRTALKPFADIGSWLFARPEVPDSEPLVEVHLFNNARSALTRGEFKAAHKALTASRSASAKRCEWLKDDDGNYNTGCGHMFFFNAGTAEENAAKYCPYCGGDLHASDRSTNNG